MLFMGPENDPGFNGLSANCLKDMTESTTLSPLCYPNNYLSDLQPEVAKPGFY